MVSDSELIERLREILSTSDLNMTTTSIVRRRLEEDFGIDLSERKAFIREQVDVYMQSQFENGEENEEEINQEGVTEEGKGEEAEEEEEEEEDEGEEAGATDGEPRTTKRKKNEVKKRGGGGGFTKLMSLSPELQKFTGVPEMARTEVVKQLWIYIKENDLQDPSNKRNILCDDTLRNIFRVDKIDMFQMNKALTKHIWPVESDETTQRSAPPPKEKKQKQDKDEASQRSLPPPKEKKRKQDKNEAPQSSAPPPKEKKRKQDKDEEEYKPEKKEKKGGNSGFLAPLKLSDPLVKFLGTGETELRRSDVVKRIWDYIKLNNLQDPSDKRQILCDEKLKELFSVETFHGFTVAKFLKAHFVKEEQ